MQIFARHVSREVAETLWQSRDQYMRQGRPQPQRLTATVLFSDIEGFTSISESLEPQILFAWLNSYLDAMAGTVIVRGGIVNKYIGDAVMAIFGAPLAEPMKPRLRGCDQRGELRSGHERSLAAARSRMGVKVSR